MDPISTAAIAAANAGSYPGLSEYSHRTIAETYAEFKERLAEQFGEESVVLKMMAKVEEAPENRIRWLELDKQIAEAEADQNPDLTREANDLLDLIQREGGSDIIGIIIRAADRSANEGDVS